MTSPAAAAKEEDAAVQVVSLYQKQQKIYARAVSGWFAGWRWALVWGTQLLFYGLPWLEWNARQAVLFDLAARRFYIFGLVLYPQDFIYLTALLIISAYSLFLFTAVAGRLWCGFACPQTVYTEIFMWVERKIQGDRNARMRRDAGPWTLDRIARAAAKNGVWLVIALWTGFTFVGYFTPIRTLANLVSQFALGPWELFWIGFYSLATFGNAGFLREQVCKYMCPYARFQSAMFDKDTLIISYDEKRGEPRGGRKRSVEPKAAGLGDCIDCSLCVQVCPTGIDIRDGLQYECIACAACIDACDSIMDKMSYPRGLIRYTTEHALKNQETHVVRPRMLVYAALLLVLVASLVTSMALRTPIILDVIRDRNALYRELPGDMIENSYTIKLINQSNDARDFRLRVSGVDGIFLDGVADTFTIAGGGVLSVPVRARAHRDNSQGVSKIDFVAEALDDTGDQRIEDSRFLGPTP